MPAIARDSLLSLEAYARSRPEFRARVLAHKKRRTLALGEHLTLVFEDELTMRYQIQEMLRIERTFEESGIQDELDAYNPLVPDGSNWKATMMIEYPDPTERQRQLVRLKGIENRVWIEVEAHGQVWAMADEDLARDNGETTSAVHFLRFELTPPMAAAAKAGAPILAGIDHPAYRVAPMRLPEEIRSALIEDLA